MISWIADRKFIVLIKDERLQLPDIKLGTLVYYCH